ncbi:protein ecdysoneless [Culicoides brevitarsis]|uniref:protein ecdysoneless n=1 Tax=Culicoides brevitarsis TaxID=469753 RepID=UPI00307B4FAE
METLRRLEREDDFVEYYLYPDLSGNAKNIEDILDQINIKIHEYTKEYIWHKDYFSLTAYKTNEDNVLGNIFHGVKKTNMPFLHGITHFGENIQDEWFVVSIMLELTRCFDNLVGKVSDSDGEFILIECADRLPKWIDSKFEGKVFLFNGHIRIVVGDNDSANTDSLDELIYKVRNNSNIFCIPNLAFECIQRRISQFPDNVRSNQHIATVFVPSQVAYILKECPEFISYATLAFCNRSPEDEKCLCAMRHFPPENRVYINVKFTKCLYAMLMCNDYRGDERTGWNLPVNHNLEYKAHDLGMKLACGFEILASMNKSKNDLDIHNNWNTFMEKLKEQKYFGNEMENTKDYLLLLEKAQTFYKQSCYTIKTNMVTRRISELLKNIDFDKNEFSASMKMLPKEDDDNWLTIDSKDLDDMLKKCFDLESNEGYSKSTKSLPYMISDFLEHKNDYKGVDIKLPSSQKQFVNNHNKIIQGQENIDFHPNEFKNAMQNLLDIVIPEDDWDSNSDMDDYDTDEELEKSFNKMDSGINKSDFEYYFKEMDKELAETTIGASFDKVKDDKDDFDDIENFQPVDINTNTVKNMVESYKAQMGNSGPASTLLNTLGVDFSEIEDLKDNKITFKNTTV